MFKIKISLLMIFALSIYSAATEQFIAGVEANIEQLDKEDQKKTVDRMIALLKKVIFVKKVQDIGDDIDKCEANFEQLEAECKQLKDCNKKAIDNAKEMLALLDKEKVLFEQMAKEDKKGHSAFKKFCYGLAGGTAAVCTSVFAYNLWQAAQEA